MVCIDQRCTVSSIGDLITGEDPFSHFLNGTKMRILGFREFQMFS